MKNARKKSIAVLAGLSVAGLVGASAATLGGINGGNLGADAASVLSCDTEGGVTVDYNTSVVNGEFVVDSVRMSDVDAPCVGQRIEITVTDNASGVLASGSRFVPAQAAFNVALDASPLAEVVDGIAIAISGTPAP